mmetsp:Transcript_49016/g.86316  ORF Transcript_49016/g.86316 Transcript_49016/m.86316 type:complete len:108 (+) Transcript_49016:638-961(+)
MWAHGARALAAAWLLKQPSLQKEANDQRGRALWKNHMLRRAPGSLLTDRQVSPALSETKCPRFFVATNAVLESAGLIISLATTAFSPKINLLLISVQVFPPSVLRWR